MDIVALYTVFRHCGKISTDTRTVEQGMLFFALRGERFDGNRFAAQALEAGAAYAVVDDPSVVNGHRYILVEDTLSALQDLAAYHRRQLKCPVIAVCGSNGKTTTKELIHAVLSTRYKVFATRGNLNNHIGTPLSLLSVEPDTDIAVIEIGANHLGETAALCRMAAPDSGLITNNGKDHLEGYGSIENVRLANGELYTWLRENGGMAFLNTDEFDLVEMAEGLHVYTYGEGTENNVSGREVPGGNTLTVACSRPAMQVRTQLFGSYNLGNVLAAIAVGKHFEVPVEKIAAAIEAYVPSSNRSRIIETGETTLVMDCYNANPASMEAALRSFAVSGEAPRMVILGDMLELGSYSSDEHYQMLNLAEELGFDRVVLVGPEFQHAGKEFPFENYRTAAEAAAHIRKEDLSGWQVLLKGSRGIALEKIVSGWIS